MKTKTVKELIEELQKMNQAQPVVIRVGRGDGYYSDHHISGPWTPPGDYGVAMMAGEQVENAVQAG